MDIARKTKEGRFLFYNEFQKLLHSDSNDEILAAIGPQWKQLAEQAEGQI